MCRCCFWFLCFSVVTSTAFARLPDDLGKCRVTDSACLKEKAGMVFRKYHKGYAPMGLVSFDPLFVDAIKVTDGVDNGKSISISLKFNNINVLGIKDARLDTFRFKNHTSDPDFDILFSIVVPRAQFIGNYDIGGRMLLLPISGNGPCNLTLENLGIKAQLLGTYMEHNGKTFMYLKTFKTKISTDRVHIRLENLFGGNQVLGDSMNEMMNESWRELYDELNPAFVQSFGGVFVKAANGVFQKNPVQKLFLSE